MGFPRPPAPAPPPPAAPEPPPWRQGLHAARVNLAPGLVLWAVAVAVVLAYYQVDTVRVVLTRLADWKTEVGLLFALVSTAVFGGVIPLLFERLRGRSVSAGVVVFAVVFWAVKGVEVELLYRLQAFIFGHGTDPATLAKKVLVDQLVYVPCWAVPTMTVAYLWRDGGFRWTALKRRLRPGWYRRRAIPIMVANWGVWIPAVTCIYLMPLPLQLPLQNLTLCLWVLLLMVIARDEPPPMPAEER